MPRNSSWTTASGALMSFFTVLLLSPLSPARCGPACFRSLLGWLRTRVARRPFLWRRLRDAPCRLRFADRFLRDASGRWRRGTARDEHVVDEEVVDQRADEPAHKRSDDRDPHIAIDVRVVAGHRDVTPTLDPGEQPWTEVTRGVDRVAGVRPERQADREHQEADEQRPNVHSRGNVELVDQRQDDADQERGADQLVQEWAGDVRVIVRRERGEDAVRGYRVRVTTCDVVGRLEAVDGVLVVQIQDRGRHERPQHLRDHVAGHLAPLEASEHGERQCPRGFDGGAADPPRHIHAHRDRQAPARGYEYPVGLAYEGRIAAAGLVQRGDDHRHDAVAEHDEHEGPQELGAVLAYRGLTPSGSRAQDSHRSSSSRLIAVPGELYQLRPENDLTRMARAVTGPFQWTAKGCLSSSSRRWRGPKRPASVSRFPDSRDYSSAHVRVNRRLGMCGRPAQRDSVRRL